MEGMLELNILSTGLKTMAMLAIVLALLMVLLYFFRRFSLQGKETKGDVRIKALSSLSLSTKDRIQVVEISGEKIVLGVSHAGISFLTKLSDPPKNRYEGMDIKNEIKE